MHTHTYMDACTSIHKCIHAYICLYKEFVLVRGGFVRGLCLEGFVWRFLSTPHNTSGPGHFPPGQFPRTIPRTIPPPNWDNSPVPLKTQLENYIYTCMHTSINIYIHAYTHRCMHTCIYAYNTYMHTYIHIFMHTYTLIYSHIY